MLYKIDDSLKKRRPETLKIETLNQELIDLIGRFKSGEEIDSDKIDFHFDELSEKGFVIPVETQPVEVITEEDNNASAD